MPAGTAGVHTVPTYCDICFWKCNAVAHVRDGQLWKIVGNPDDPLCQGRLCPRGTGGVGAHFDPDRLRAPLMRRKERGEEKWVEVTWDEALGYIAERMQTIKAKYGPEAVAMYSHGIGGTFLKHTLRAYGITNSAAPSFAQCRGPRDVGFNLTYGEEVGSPERTDIRNARCLVLIGSHLGENMHNTQVQEFAEANGNGATIIVADPRFSIAASKAKHYLPVKPGTDLALLLAWMNVLVTEGLYDTDYVTKHGYGFDYFKAELPRRAKWRVTVPRRWCTRDAMPPGMATMRSAAAPSRCSMGCSAAGVVKAASTTRRAWTCLLIRIRLTRSRRAARWTTRTSAFPSPRRPSPPASARRRSPASRIRSRAGSCTRPT